MMRAAQGYECVSGGVAHDHFSEPRSTMNASRTSLRTVVGSVDRPFLALDTTVRLPTAMLPLGVLLYVADRSASYATGGLAVAALSVGGGLGGAFVGMGADRFGQRVVALLTTLVQVASLSTVLLLHGTEPLWATLLLVGSTGLANPQAGAMARSRWGVRADRRPDRASFVSTAMAFEGAVDEMSFVVGPVLVSTVAAVLSPALGLALALLIAVVTQVGFGLHRTALAGRGPRDPESVHRARPDVPWARLACVMLAMGAIGVVFGTTQTGVAARMAEGGTDELTGVVYALMGVGSAITGLLTTRLPAALRLETRIAVGGMLLALGGLLVAATERPVPLALGCLVLGVALAPALISAYALAQQAAPAGWSTTVMTGLGTANVVGVAAGAAVAGLLVDRTSIGTALLVDAGAGVVLLLAGLAASTLRPHPSPDRRDVG